jgi:hypothetical protein
MLSKLPDWIQDMYKTVYDDIANTNVLTFLKRELVHAIWLLLLTDDFVNAYTFGIVVLCADGVNRRLFPGFFTYSADYPEKCVHSILYSILANKSDRIILATIKFLGRCLCPLYTCPMEKVQDLGTKADDTRRNNIRVDSEK